MESEKRSGSGVQRNHATNTGAMYAADEKQPEAPNVEMGAETCARCDKRREARSTRWNATLKALRMITNLAATCDGKPHNTLFYEQRS